CWEITRAAGTRHCSPLSSRTHTCVESLRVCGAGGITVPHQPSWPRTMAGFTYGIPISRNECGGFPTPTRKKDNGQNDEGNEHHATNDHALRAYGPLIRSDFVWPSSPPSARDAPRLLHRRCQQSTWHASACARGSFSAA